MDEPIPILLDQLNGIATLMLAAVPQIVITLIVLTPTYFATRLIRKITRRTFRNTHLRDSLKNLFALLSSIAVWTFGLMLAALIAFPGLTPTKLLAALGIGSVAIGFAFKDIFETFVPASSFYCARKCASAISSSARESKARSRASWCGKPTFG